jgi:hypothetical protein
MRHAVVIVGCATALFVQLPAAHAQRLTVQQPILETFGVGTTVSVPDRGRMHIAGSSRSLASRSNYGPLRSGTNMGLSQQSSGVSVGVYVHDLAEMDRRILAGAELSRSSQERTVLPDGAEQAYETLRTSARGRSLVNWAQNTNRLAAARTIVPNVTAVEGPSADRLLDRARQAESNGKRQLALAYLRSARDLGSAEARHKIERLSPERQSR